MEKSEKQVKGQTKWTEAYKAKAYDRIQIVVRKGEREKLKEYAKANGETVSALINRLLAGEVEDFDPVTGETSGRKKEN